MIGHMYTAFKGKGAYLNGTKLLKSSGVKDIGKAMMIMELPVGANDEKKKVAIANLTHMMDKAHAVRAPGPAALDIAWVGAGSADCFFHFGNFTLYNFTIFQINSTCRYPLLGHGSRSHHCIRSWRSCPGSIWR